MWFNKQMVRRPENSFIIGLFFNFNDKIHATIENIFFGKTKDGFESVGYYEMPSYNIVNVTVNYYINTNSSFYVKAINLFNEEYQPAFGFVSSGITIYAGFNYKI
jgi:outer membrane receptor protein involved in Fe transport